MEKCIECEYGIAKSIEDADDKHDMRRVGYKLCFKCNMLKRIFMYSKHGAGFAKIIPDKECPFT